MGLESSAQNHFVDNYCFGLFSIVWNYGGLIMPYIKDEDKTKFEDLIEIAGNIDSAGEMNYVITMLARTYIERHGLCYQTLNDVVGALEGCKFELYRRVLAPYEDLKIKENGDVY